jgi:hypothetical protein
MNQPQDQASQPPPELAALLDDPNMLPQEREALTRLLAVSCVLEALATEDTE